MWVTFTKIDPNSYIANKMIADRIYEGRMGIQNADHSSLLSPITHNAETDYMRDSLLELTIRRIMQLKLTKLTGMSVVELLDLPTYELQMYFRSAVIVSKKESQDTESLLDGLDA